jgi:hypothetical protein
MNPQVRYHIQNNLTVNPALSHLNLFRTKPYFLKKYFNIIPLSTLGLTSGFIPASFQNKLSMNLISPIYQSNSILGAWRKIFFQFIS